MALHKFHEKNKALLGKIEAVSGTPETTITSQNAVSFTDVTGAPSVATGEYVFKGSKTDRSSYVYQKDDYIELMVDTPLQVIGDRTYPVSEAAFPLSSYFQACGGYSTQSGSGFAAANYWEFDNSLDTSGSTLSAIYIKQESASFDEKDLFCFGLTGTMDFTLKAADSPATVKFNLKGSYEDSFQNTYKEPAYGDQRTLIGLTPKLKNITKAQVAQLNGAFSSFGTAPVATYTGNIVTLTATGLGTACGAAGDIRAVKLTLTPVVADDYLYLGTFLVTVTGANTVVFKVKKVPVAAAPTITAVTVGPAPKSFCFDTLSASNFFGLDVARNLTSCEESWEITPIATDVSLSILEQRSNRGKVVTATSAGAVATITFAVPSGTSNLVTPVVNDLITVTGMDVANYNVVDATILSVATVAQTTTVTYAINNAGNVAGVTTKASYEIANKMTTFDPENHILDFYGLKLSYGTSIGRIITVLFTQLQLSNYKEGKMGNYGSFDLTWKNTGISSIKLS